MKLKTILKENAVLTFRDLNSLQVSMLTKIASGNLDYDNIAPKDWATIDNLTDLGLLDDGGQLTQTGQRAVELAKRNNGSFDKKHAAARDNVLGRKGGPSTKYTDHDDGSEVQDDEPAAFQNQWGSIAHAD